MDPDFLFYILIGFAAQLVDGALGMAYGLISSTCMMALGLPPVTISASVHAAEVFTTAASGLVHFSFRNIDRALFVRLVFPGMIGGACGAYLLTSFPADAVKPFIAIYLAAMGVIILYKAIKKKERNSVPESPPLSRV